MLVPELGHKQRSGYQNNISRTRRVSEKVFIDMTSCVVFWILVFDIQNAQTISVLIRDQNIKLCKKKKKVASWRQVLFRIPATHSRMFQFISHSFYFIFSMCQLLTSCGHQKCSVLINLNDKCSDRKCWCLKSNDNAVLSWYYIATQFQ